jgi:hypothetical protein
MPGLHRLPVPVTAAVTMVRLTVSESLCAMPAACPGSSALDDRAAE